MISAIRKKTDVLDVSDRDDSEVWEEFKAGDEKAIVYIFQQNYQLIFRYGIKLCRNKDLVKDCIQDIFTELWDRREKVRAVHHIKAYLLKYFRRHLLNKLKLEGKTVALDHVALSACETEDSFESVLINEQTSSEMKERLASSFEKLSKRQQEIIYLRFFSDFSYEQIADIMDLRYQSVRNLLHESLKVLRKDPALALPMLLFELLAYV